ncbi:MAG: response regulator transcription factor [Candidatus Limnocylindria bacterium]
MREGGSRVLVVEDDDTLRESLAEVLGDEGYEVRCAAHGGEAVEQLAAWEADLILLDLMMPNLDAYGFRAEQRRRGIASDAKTLVVSAARDLESAATTLGADAWLAKPFSLAQLLALVATLLAPADR